MLGVASVLLRACSVPKVPASPLVGLWSFDETSPASAVFEDQGEAAVPMTIVGAWADLTTGSLVQGVDGTSAYTNGSTYATIPANQPAHALSALTISFYFQRNSAAAKQILLAAGDGSEAGDFSIEVLAGGRLRGWHTGPDARLRFFEGSSGIAGTNLQVGTAHRIDLSLGPQGARIYLDGAEPAVATIPVNVNGWNNARKKYLGRWTDGVSAPADGAFDRLQLWDRQLTPSDIAEIAPLEPAQSATLPQPPSQSTGLPGSIAEVESLAGGSVTKQVAADGTGSHTSLQTALSIAVGGDIIAVKGVAGNHKYYETWTLNGRSGTSANPIQVWGWSPDGTQPEITAEHEGGVTWSVHNASKSIYKTSVSGASFAYGFLPEDEGGWQLLMHQTQTNFERTQTDKLYMGPSMWASGGTVYVRTQHGRRQTERLVPDGILNTALPVEPNPNNWSEFRFSTVSGHAWSLKNCDHIKFHWLNWFGGQHGIEVFNGSVGVSFRNGQVRASRFGIRISGSSTTGFVADHFDVRQMVPLWLARDDVKGSARILDDFKDQSYYFDGCGGAEISNSVSWYPFDWMLSGSAAKNVRMHHNVCVGARDDSAQMGTGTYNIELDHNVLLGFAGPGHNAGNGQPSGSEAQVYLHHNIIDCGHAVYETGLGLIGSNDPGFIYENEKCHASHDTPNGPFPYRTWNNTCITRDTVGWGQGSNMGYIYGDSANRVPAGADRAHEFWNGIIISPTNSKILGATNGDVVTHHPSVSNNTPVEMMDGCMFKKAAGSAALFHQLTRLPGPVRANFATLAAYKALSGGTHYLASEDTEKYPVAPFRWNGNSLEEDPLLGDAVHTSLTAYTLDAYGRFQMPANWAMYVPSNPKCQDQGVDIGGRWSLLSPPIGPNDRSGIESSRTRFYIGAIDPVDDPDGTSIGVQD